MGSARLLLAVDVRKTHDERGAYTLQAFSEHLTLMQRGHHRDQVETDSCPGNTGGVAAAKIALEQPLAIARGNAYAAVSNLDHQPSRFVAGHNFDRSSRRRILDGICD